jgi:hypothetical protein
MATASSNETPKVCATRLWRALVEFNDGSLSTIKRGRRCKAHATVAGDFVTSFEARTAS